MIRAPGVNRHAQAELLVRFARIACASASTLEVIASRIAAAAPLLRSNGPLTSSSAVVCAKLLAALVMSAAVAAISVRVVRICSTISGVTMRRLAARPPIAASTRSWIAASSRRVAVDLALVELGRKTGHQPVLAFHHQADLGDPARRRHREVDVGPRPPHGLDEVSPRGAVTAIAGNCDRGERQQGLGAKSRTKSRTRVVPRLFIVIPDTLASADCLSSMRRDRGGGFDDPLDLGRRVLPECQIEPAAARASLSTTLSLPRSRHIVRSRDVAQRTRRLHHDDRRLVGVLHHAQLRRVRDRDASAISLYGELVGSPTSSTGRLGPPSSTSS
jgi:hypothetical protein